MTIGCIVEGHGEDEAVPVLIRRIAGDLNIPVAVGGRIRVPKSLLLRPGELEKRVHLAASKTGDGSSVLVLIDADDDPPLKLAESMRRRIQTSAPHIPCGIAVAVMEFESWLIAGADGLRGRRGFANDAEPILDPESKRDAKAWLSEFMPREHPYMPTLHQAAFTSLFDMSKARECSPSFDRCYREIERLLRPA